MAEHRVLMLRGALLGRQLPDRSSDPRIRSIEDELAQLRVAPDPDPQFRADLRAQLVAIAPRLVAEGTPAQVGTTGKHRAGATRTAPETAPAERIDARGRRFTVVLSLRIVTAVLFVAALLLGGAYWQSRDALPGDHLYGLKRAGEGVRLTFAGSDRGQDQLTFSEQRVTEVLQLWRNGQPNKNTYPNVDVDARTAGLIRETLRSANSELRAGTSQLNQDAVRTKSTKPIQTMTTWAAGQQKTLASIEKAMKPSKTKLLVDIDAATTLLSQANERAAGLRTTVKVDCPQHARTDQFGPKPCS